MCIRDSRFRDHYLEVPVDLSEVTFVTTANSLQTIPRPLLDRMEVIEVSSYTENEKLHIATEHLIPKQLERHGLTKEQLTISKGVIWKIAQNYTKEAGVRQMEREIGNICRKAAREIYEHDKKRVQVDVYKRQSIRSAIVSDGEATSTFGACRIKSATWSSICSRSMIVPPITAMTSPTIT